jgi:hypothetical protein
MHFTTGNKPSLAGTPHHTSPQTIINDNFAILNSKVLTSGNHTELSTTFRYNTNNNGTYDTVLGITHEAYSPLSMI